MVEILANIYKIIKPDIYIYVYIRNGSSIIEALAKVC